MSTRRVKLPPAKTDREEGSGTLGEGRDRQGASKTAEPVAGRASQAGSRAAGAGPHIVCSRRAGLGMLSCMVMLRSENLSSNRKRGLRKVRRPASVESQEVVARGTGDTVWEREGCWRKRKRGWRRPDMDGSSKFIAE